ncbi:hypothetical protein SAMN04489722_101330 [Algibacter lectus]|uniref:hypothetical protein n=1 Tax=Algibacter lectus TaxID=221126 RepID=UPI0008DFE1A9|nr:hypothetical protein [Algibacter lectus]SFB94811.1 hypothetical protein SAMN04489722_101330 [Algibacter lectus]
MTKKTVFIIFFLAIAVIGFYTFNESKKESTVYVNLEKECLGNEIFNQKVEACLAVMETTAEKYSEQGVAVIAFVPGVQSEYWNSRMKVVGTLSTKQHNFLAVASAKASEMALTLQNSGSVRRKPLIGELGYKGGVIKKVACGYLIASFSGAPAEIDAEISKIGVDFLSQFY